MWFECWEREASERNQGRIMDSRDQHQWIYRPHSFGTCIWRFACSLVLLDEETLLRSSVQSHSGQNARVSASLYHRGKVHEDGGSAVRLSRQRSMESAAA